MKYLVIAAIWVLITLWLCFTYLLRCLGWLIIGLWNFEWPRLDENYWKPKRFFDIIDFDNPDPHDLKPSNFKSIYFFWKT